MVNDKPVAISREHLFGERRSLLQRLGQIGDLLKIPRSVIPKRLRKPWIMFLEAYREVTLDDYPEEDGEEDDE